MIRLKETVVLLRGLQQLQVDQGCPTHTQVLLQGSGVECFISQPGLVATPLNGRKLDHQKLTANLVDLATKVYGQSPARGSLCLQRPATDPSVTGQTFRSDLAVLDLPPGILFCNCHLSPG